MKKILLFFLLILANQVKGQDFLWATILGGINNEESNEIKVDAAGNVYTTGHFSSTVDFDPGPGVYNLTPVGNFDVFISKLDAAGNFVWAKRIGGNDEDKGFSIDLDTAGNVYATGYYRSTADFDPGAGVFNMTTAPGHYNTYILKLDTHGNFIWAKNIGGASGYADGFKIVLDHSGNSHILGTIASGPVDMDPGAGTYLLAPTASSQGYICKLDASGNFIWAKTFNTGLGTNVTSSVAIDSSSNVFITGIFNALTDFDPGPGTFNITPTSGNNVFLVQLNAAGNFVWAFHFPSTASVKSNVTFDNNSNILITGAFYGTTDFDPGPGVVNMSSPGVESGFICKLTHSGSFIWARQFSGTSICRPTGIVTDYLDNVYTAGEFKGFCDFDPGINTFHLTAPSTSLSHIYFSKLDDMGNFLWAGYAPSTLVSVPFSIESDAQGNIYSTGFVRGITDLDPGPDTMAFSAISYDAFILKLSFCGLVPSVTSQSNSCFGMANGSVSLDVHNGIAPFTYSWDNDSTGAILTGLGTGTYTCTITDDSGCVAIRQITIHETPDIQFSQTLSLCSGSSVTVGANTYSSSGTYIDVLTSHNGCDSTVTTTLMVDPAIVNMQTITLCAGESLMVGAHTYTISGTYLDTLIAANGCDSTITTVLSIRPPIINALHLSICDGESITVGTSTYSVPGTYTDVLIAADGCDSTITTILGVKPAATSSQTLNICHGGSVTIGTNTYNATGTYVDTLAAANGCDSTVTTSLTVELPLNDSQSLTICQGESVTVGTNTYNVSGTYVDTLTAANGCDSTVTTNLTVNTVDLTTSISAPSITANQTGAVYQWLSCSNGFSMIPGETAQTYTATSNGSYAATITIGGCSDTTTCVNITGLEVGKAFAQEGIWVYPNPTNSSITISTNGTIAENISLLDLSGRTIRHVDPTGTPINVDLTHLQSGIYLVKVSTPQGQKVVKLVKE